MNPTITSDAEPGCPLPVQFNLYVLSPVSAIVIVSEPNKGFAPTHAPEAMHSVALLEAQVRVVVVVTSTSSGEAFNETVTAGGGLPPPPHEITSSEVKNMAMQLAERLLFI